MRRQSHSRPSVRAVRIAECDMHAGIFFVLQNLPDHIFQFDVGADGKLADAIAVLVGVRVTPEVIFQFAIGGMGFGQAIALYLNGQRVSPAGCQTWRKASRPRLRRSQTFR